MRKAGALVIFAAVTLVADARPTIAQTGRDIVNIFGAIVQSAMVQAAQTEWKKVPASSLSCVDENLRQRGISLESLISNGIGPTDNRVSALLSSCRSQVASQQANARSESPVEPARPDSPRPSSQASKYKIDKIPLGSVLAFETESYREYQCKPSDQYSGFVWCQKQRQERAARGDYLSSYSLLHANDGRVFYSNRYLSPAFFDPGESSADIERLSRAFGEQPRSIPMPQSNAGVSGIIAYWGDVTLEPLDSSALATLSSGRSPGGILLDYLGDFQASIRQRLPVYRVGGGAGYVWAESHDLSGRGRLRFFAVDASSLTAIPSGEAKVSPSPAMASDPWKECQSSDTDKRLAGCTQVINTKGSDRIRLADAYDGRCAAYNQKQQYDAALSDCKSAIDLNPKYSYAYNNLGAAYLGLNDPSSALSALNKAVTLKPNFIWSRLSRAKALESTGARDEALKDYQLALFIDPNNQAAKDGVIGLSRLNVEVDGAPACLGDANEQGRYIVAGSKSSSGDLETAASTIFATAQVYRTKLTSQIEKTDQLKRQQEASEEKQRNLAGMAEDRKKMVSEIQKLSDASAEAQARFSLLSSKVVELEGRVKQLEIANARDPRLKAARQELAKLQSDRAGADREQRQRSAARDEAVAGAQRTAAGIAEAAVRSQMIAAAKETSESCARQIRASIDALDQKANEIRVRQNVQALTRLRANAEHLLTDLSEFARKSPDLIPLDAGPIVAALKQAIGAADERLSTTFSTLEGRLNEVPEFKRFRMQREESRQEVAKAELNQLVDNARSISEFIESHVRRNITADNAQELMKLRGNFSEALIAPEAENLRLVISKSLEELRRYNLEMEYRDYRAKHPIQARRSLPETTERNRTLVEGPLDETLILVNESGRAGVVRNLRGDLIFDGGQASLCFPHDNALDAFALSEVKRRIQEKGGRTVSTAGTACSTENFDSFDIIAVNRGLFATLSADSASSILNGLDRGELTILGVLSDRELQVARNGDSIRSLQLENDILRKSVEGFGLVSVGNGSSVVCQTLPDRPKAHEALVLRNSDRLRLELGSPPKVITTSIESAFVSAKRGQCGAIYGAPKDLKDLVTSLQRDKLNYHVLPVWFSAAEVEAEQKDVDARRDREWREQQAIEQKRKDDRLRVEVERRQTDAERKEREARLQKENGTLARGLQEKIFDEVKAFAKTDAEDRTYVKQKWPGLAAWYRERIRGEWELDSVGSELRDYGIVEWKNRVLEAGFVAITFKMKHRGLGEYQQKCFFVGYVADREFDIVRDPIGVNCEDENAINRYNVAHKFSSKWFAR